MVSHKAMITIKEPCRWKAPKKTGVQSVFKHICSPHKPNATPLRSLRSARIIRYPLVAIIKYSNVQTGPKTHAGGATLGATQLFAFKPPTNQNAPAAATSVQA